MKLDEYVTSILDKEIDDYEEMICSLKEPIFSNKHNRIMKKAFKRASASKFNRRREVVSDRAIFKRRIIAIALVSVLLMASTVAAFATIYPKYYMVIKERLREWTITFISSEEERTSEQFVKKVGAIPKNYEVSNEVSEDSAYSVSYINANGNEIVYVQQTISQYTVSGIDSENDSQKIEVVNGIKTVVMEKNGCYTLFWVTDNCTCTLVGNCSFKVLTTYIESIK